MKNTLYFFVSLCFAIAAAFLVQYWLNEYDNPGYVLIGIGRWSMETSLVAFSVFLIIGFFILYFFFRLLVG